MIKFKGIQAKKGDNGACY